MILRSFLVVVASTALAAPLPGAEPADNGAAIAAAIAAPGRPDADRARDAERKPAELIGFAGLQAGDAIADFVPGGAYFTRLFAGIVGQDGRVYAYTPSDLLDRSPKAADDARALAAQAGFENVIEIEPAFAEMRFPQPLDMVWISQIYHDLPGIWGSDAAAVFNAAVFASLRPGGIYLVTDHVAAPGAGEADMKTLHRVDPELVKAQVTAAGFVLDGESDALANPDDPHDIAVFTPWIRGKTDQFVLKFRKPL